MKTEHAYGAEQKWILCQETIRRDHMEDQRTDRTISTWMGGFGLVPFGLE
jgi:hypothetical protein